MESDDVSTDLVSAEDDDEDLSSDIDVKNDEVEVNEVVEGHQGIIGLENEDGDEFDSEF